MGNSKHACDSDKKERLWQQCVSAWQGSGLTQEEFCNRRGLALSTFTLWRRKLKERERAAPSGPAEFIPVHFKTSSSAQGAPGAWACELLGPKLRLRLRDWPGTGRLRNLAAMLAGAGQ